MATGIFHPIIDGYLRDQDSELKLLEQIWREIPTNIQMGTRLVIDLYTERPPCGSCGGHNAIGGEIEGVIDEFARAAWEELGIEIVVNVLYGFSPGERPQGVSVMP